MPRYRVRASNEPLEHPEKGRVKEANLHHGIDSWKAKLYESIDTADYLKAGQSIRLFHNESERYLTADDDAEPVLAAANADSVNCEGVFTFEKVKDGLAEGKAYCCGCGLL